MLNCNIWKKYNNYQKRSDCRKSESLVTTKICVTEKCSEQGCNIGAAIEDVDDICSCNAFEVEHSSKIDQKVG